MRGLANTPKPIIQRLHAELLKILAMPDIKARWAEFGMTASTISPDDLKAQTAKDIATLRKIAQQANVKP